MKAAIFKKKNTIHIEELPLPDTSAGMVRVKVLGCGVCGTDLHIYKGENPLARPPVVLGHEIFAELDEVGAGVKGLKKGSKVALDPLWPCGRCAFCRRGAINHCEDLTVTGYHVDGGYCQHILTRPEQVVPVPEEFSLKQGILVEPVACVLHGHDRLAAEAAGTALVIGAGPIGLIWGQMLLASGVKRLFMTDLVSGRRKSAEAIGAEVIKTDGKDLEKMAGKASAGGFDVVVDASGDPSAVTTAVKLTASLGTMVIFGVCPENSRSHIDPYEVYNKEMKIIASKMPPRTLGRAVGVLESGVVDAEKVVSHVLPLSGLMEALRMFEEERDKVLKMAIDPWL